MLCLGYMFSIPQCNGITQMLILKHFNRHYPLIFLEMVYFVIKGAKYETKTFQISFQYFRKHTFVVIFKKSNVIDQVIRAKRKHKQTKSPTHRQIKGSQWVAKIASDSEVRELSTLASSRFAFDTFSVCRDSFFIWTHPMSRFVYVFG